MPSAWFGWAQWSYFTQLAAWSDEDPKKSRSKSELPDFLLQQIDESGDQRFRWILESFLGDRPSTLDAAAAKEIVDHIAERTVLGNPYGAAAFWEAVLQIAPWAQERGFANDKTLVKAIQNHLKRRVDEVPKRLEDLASHDPILQQNLKAAAQRL